MYCTRCRPATEPISPSSVRRDFPRSAVWVGGVVAWLLSSCGVLAGTDAYVWLPSSSQPANRISDDLELGLRARKALQQDGTPVGQMLGVSIHNRIATLWGTAPSASAARLAEACLRNLPGLAAIRNELHVQTSAEWEVDQAENVRSREALADQGTVSGMLVHRTDEPAPKPSPAYVWRPAGSKRSAVLPPPLPQQVVEHPKMPGKPGPECLPGFPKRDSTRMLSPSFDALQPRSRADGTILVMPALTLPLALPANASARTAPASPPDSVTSLTQTIEAVRLADERFYGVRVEVRGDTVYLAGTVYSWEQLFELARSIARLPGVRQVRFGNVHAEYASNAP